MRIRIDLKIVVFFILFYFTNQIKIYLIIMLFAMAHELGHIIAGLILKMKPEKIEIMPFGLSVSFYKNYNDRNLKIKEIFVAIAGPLTSLAVAMWSTIPNVIYSNLLILLFNLIPIYPLDGGRILEGILNIELGERKARKLIDEISNITMIILTIICSIAVYYYKNIAVFFICIFLWLLVLKEKNAKTIDILQEK